ncbi:hypothetical protein STUTZSP0542_04430 [Stutzerimonas marianensis]
MGYFFQNDTEQSGHGKADQHVLKYFRHKAPNTKGDGLCAGHAPEKFGVPIIAEVRHFDTCPKSTR